MYGYQYNTGDIIGLFHNDKPNVCFEYLLIIKVESQEDRYYYYSLTNHYWSHEPTFCLDSLMLTRKIA